MTLLLALAAGLTGYVVLILTNRRLRAERAVLVLQTARRRGAYVELLIENVGARAALDVGMSHPCTTAVLRGGLRPGDGMTILIPETTKVEFTFRDADETVRKISRNLRWTENEVVVEARVKPYLGMRLMIALGLRFGD